MLDFIGTSVNGDFILKAALQNISVGNVNGDIRVAAVDDSMKNLDAKVVNGDIKVVLPQTQGIEGLAKTSLGAIKNRLSEFEVIREKLKKRIVCYNLEDIIRKIRSTSNYQQRRVMFY